MDCMKEAKDRIILALDVDSLEEARGLVQELKEHVGVFKVGLQLFSAVGPDVFKMIEDEGAKCYFDGKFYFPSCWRKIFIRKLVKK